MLQSKLKMSMLLLFLNAAFFCLNANSQATVLSDPSELTVFFKDIDGTPIGQQWRRLAFKIQNNSGSAINISSLKLIYSFTDTNKQISSSIWSYSVHSADWTVQGGQINEVTANIRYYEKQPTSTGNCELVLQFGNRNIPAGGLAEIQLGLHNSDWSNVDENNDPSYISSSDYVVNDQITIVPVIPSYVNDVLDQNAILKGVDPSTSSISETFAQNFTDLEGNYYTKKYVDTLGNTVIITVNDSGIVFDSDSLPIMNRLSQIQKYGTVSPQLFRKLNNTDSNKVIPVSINSNLKGISYNRPPVITTDNPIDYETWKAANINALEQRKAQIRIRNIELANFVTNMIAADTTLNDFDPKISLDDNNGILTCRLPVTIINSISHDTLSILVSDCDSVIPKQDLWTAGFRMNVDNMHGHGNNGSDIKVANWEMGYPNFENQLYLPPTNVRFSKQYIIDSLDTSRANDQHIAYMLSAIRNNRTNQTDPSAPTTYCGTGFSPGADLYLANYTIKYAGDYLVNDMLANPLKWCTNRDISVINQSWHTTKGYKTISKGGISYGYDSEYDGNVTFDDQYIDLIASTYPYPTICQASGNIDSTSNEYVNHKGYNTIVVGQDLRDGGMSPISVFRNPSSKQELPHVTCGVSVSPGTSVFENSDGSSIVTPNGATSMASAMCAGFVASLQSINPTLLRNSPWAIRALLMAGSDNILGSTWSDNANDDQKDGAGRLNGINSWLSASNPYSTGTGLEHGFYIGEIPKNTSFSKDIPIIVRNPSINGAVNNGNLRIALSWIGNVDPTNYVSKLSDLDLELIGPDSSIIAKSASLVNPVEMIAITNAQKDQQYIIRIKTAKNVNYATPFSVAWVNR